LADEPASAEDYTGGHPWAKQYELHGVLTENSFFAEAKWSDTCERIFGVRLTKPT
jgi:hypothetical protein